MHCKPFIVFYHLTGYLDRICLLNLQTFNELISVLCAISFWLCRKCHMTKMIFIDSISIHELSFKKLNTTKVVVPNAFIYPNV